MPEIKLFLASGRSYLNVRSLGLLVLWFAGLLLVVVSDKGLAALLITIIVFEVLLLAIEERLSRDLGRQASSVSASTLLAYAGAFLITPGYLILHVLLRLSLNELFRPSVNMYRFVYLAVRVSLAWLPAMLILSLGLKALVIDSAAVLALALVAMSIQEAITERWIMPRVAGISGGPHLYLARVASGTMGVLAIYQLYVWDGPIGIALFGFSLAAFLAAATQIVQKSRSAIKLAAEETARRQAAEAAVQDRRRAVEKLAYSDTFIEGLGNRRRFERDLETLHNADALLVLGDVSGLKTVNDARGHPVGDRLLAAIGRALYTVSRERGLAYHFPGGDEYALLIERFPHDRVGALIAEIDSAVSVEVSREPELAGIRTWLRTGWAQGQSDPNQLRASAEAMLTERGLAEKRAGLGGRA